MTIDSDFEELICVECKLSRLTWNLESPHVHTDPTLCFYCKDRGNNERLCFLFQKIPPSLFCIFFIFIFYGPVVLMTTGNFVAIWAHGKREPVWSPGSSMAESLCAKSPWCQGPDVNTLTLFRDTWK